MSAFGSMLTSLPQLQTFIMGHLGIRDEYFLQLTPGLGRCSQLRHLRMFCCGLTNSLSMALLASVLPCLHHMQELHIDRNEIGDEGLAVLLLGLEECSQLSVLSLAKIGLVSPKSLLAIASLLGKLFLLVNVDLSGNKCCDISSAIQLCYAVEQHPSLEAVDPPEGIDLDIDAWLDTLLLQRANRRSSSSG